VGGAGEGVGTSALLSTPSSLLFDGARAVFADAGNNRLRAVDVATGATSLLAGSGSGAWSDGSAGSGGLPAPRGVALDPATLTLVITDASNRVRRLACSTPTSTPTPTIGASPSAPPSPTPSAPPSPTAPASPSPSPQGCAVTLLAGSGSAGFQDALGPSAFFNNPGGLALDATDSLFLADRNNLRLRRMDTQVASVSTFAGSGVSGSTDARGVAALFSSPTGLVFDAQGALFVADGNRLRRVTPEALVTTLAGSGSPSWADGVGTFAAFNSPAALAVSPVSGALVVADTSNNRVRVVTAAAAVSTLAGSGGAGWVDGFSTSAQFWAPRGVAAAPSRC
jgi:DNA-binding beta-propeller fold protein YncE